MDGNSELKKRTKDLPTQIFNGKEYRLYKGERYFSRGTKRLHRVVWEFYNGEIPFGYHIHHKDGNTSNNSIENLNCVSGSMHLRFESKRRIKENPEWFKEFHKKGIEKAKEWHKSKEGIEWHKKQAKNTGFGKRTFGARECEICKGEFTAKKNSQMFCSNNCKSKHRRINKIDEIIRECVICENGFEINKYSRTKTCSSKCKSKLSSQSLRLNGGGAS